MNMDLHPPFQLQNGHRNDAFHAGLMLRWAGLHEVLTGVDRAPTPYRLAQ